MKTVLVLIICSISLLFCNSKAEQQERPGKEIAYVNSDTVHFDTHLKPILQKNCSPCHFTGGKMYGKMPFDKAETLISHGEKILKRIKDENENSLIKQFLLQSNGLK